MNFMTTSDDKSSEQTATRDYARIAEAIGFIVARRPHQPSLDEVAAHVGLSAFHLQRLFKRWAGVSPKQFMGYLTLEHAKDAMRRSSSVMDAAYEAGLSGPSRLHDLFVTHDAMTPGEYKARGAALEIRYGFADTPFGRAIILMTARGICGLEFVDTTQSDALGRARAEWPLGNFVADPSGAVAVAGRIFAAASRQPLQLLLRGTNFQIQVWSALLKVPEGCIVSYGDVAHAISRPSASRAVGAALGRNPIAYLVPCHRVLRGTADFKAYKWGAERRHALLAWEGARAQPPA